MTIVLQQTTQSAGRSMISHLINNNNAARIAYTADYSIFSLNMMRFQTSAAHTFSVCMNWRSSQTMNVTRRTNNVT